MILKNYHKAENPPFMIIGVNGGAYVKSLPDVVARYFAWHELVALRDIAQLIQHVILVLE